MQFFKPKAFKNVLRSEPDTMLILRDVNVFDISVLCVI